MGLLFDFFQAFLFEIIFCVIFAGGFFTLYINKIRNSINKKAVGISHIYTRGKDIKNFQKAIENASNICIISFVPYSLIFDNRVLFTKKIKEGCRIKILMGDKDSALLKDLSQIEYENDTDIADKVDLLIRLLDKIQKDAGPEATGVFEVKQYSTEIRNPVTICFSENNISAFLTISLPPKRSIDATMIEYKG